uniref:Uncharacterized protein n=1 Tax=Mycena chlorophos TaxID=658473 RepID=A0ABQ0L4W0_MYCCL|nr:predicted protein [Mycena chlorophos]
MTRDRLEGQPAMSLRQPNEVRLQQHLQPRRRLTFGDSIALRRRVPGPLPTNSYRPGWEPYATPPTTSPSCPVPSLRFRHIYLSRDSANPELQHRLQTPTTRSRALRRPSRPISGPFPFRLPQQEPKSNDCNDAASAPRQRGRFCQRRTCESAIPAPHTRPPLRLGPKPGSRVVELANEKQQTGCTYSGLFARSRLPLALGPVSPTLSFPRYWRRQVSRTKDANPDPRTCLLKSANPEPRILQALRMLQGKVSARRVGFGAGRKRDVRCNALRRGRIVSRTARNSRLVVCCG